MDRCLANLWRDEDGMVLSAELVIIVTVVVIGLIVGLAQVQTAVVSELQGTAFAISRLNQSFAFTGFHGCIKQFGPTSWTAGSLFIDTFGTCIGTAGPFPMTCDIGGYAYGTCATSSVVTPGVVDTTCPTCVPEVVEPCLTCPPADGPTLPVAPQPQPRPEIPAGPVPQNLPQQ